MSHPASRQPLIVDLQMSDQEYLELLAAGRDPVREQWYVAELVHYNIPVEKARSLAPLFTKTERTLEEKIQVGNAIHFIWEQLANVPSYQYFQQ
ncbi:MAG: hypothetical protein SFW36_09105 [Leptolyngbyaceae cyanobacterium bins.59]|nr:hypothetical protein [Leptolyngbyaceae cyanobacterium bins.59]